MGFENTEDRLCFSDQLKLLDERTINIDPNGDTILAVHGDDGESRTFRVSSQVMRLASSHWRKMLDVEHGFKESTTTGSISLHEDNIQAVFLVLLASHLRFQEIPTTLKFMELYELCVTCDKYFCMPVMRPWIYRWMDPCKPKATSAEWARIAWVVGDRDEFCRTAIQLITTCKTNQGNQCLNPSNQVIDYILPPGLSDAILKSRHTTLVALIECCHTMVYKYGYTDEGFLCKSNDNEDACDALIYGHLLRRLQKMALWPGSPEQIVHAVEEKSIEELFNNIKTIESYIYPDGDDHEECGCTAELHSQAQALVDGIGSEVLESNRKQLEIRRKELGGSKMNLSKYQT